MSLAVTIFQRVIIVSVKSAVRDMNIKVSIFSIVPFHPKAVSIGNRRFQLTKNSWGIGSFVNWNVTVII